MATGFGKAMGACALPPHFFRWGFRVAVDLPGCLSRGCRLAGRTALAGLDNQPGTDGKSSVAMIGLSSRPYYSWNRNGCLCFKNVITAIWNCPAMQRFQSIGCNADELRGDVMDCLLAAPHGRPLSCGAQPKSLPLLQCSAFSEGEFNFDLIPVILACMESVSDG